MTDTTPYQVLLARAVTRILESEAMVPGERPLVHRRDIQRLLRERGVRAPSGAIASVRNVRTLGARKKHRLFITPKVDGSREHWKLHPDWKQNLETVEREVLNRHAPSLVIPDVASSSSSSSNTRLSPFWGGIARVLHKNRSTAVRAFFERMQADLARTSHVFLWDKRFFDSVVARAKRPVERDQVHAVAMLFMTSRGSLAPMPAETFARVDRMLETGAFENAFRAPTLTSALESTPCMEAMDELLGKTNPAQQPVLAVSAIQEFLRERARDRVFIWSLDDLVSFLPRKKCSLSRGTLLALCTFFVRDGCLRPLDPDDLIILESFVQQCVQQ